ncbi:hypothetical protein F4813DRAFT_356986 [Daldinia decipiens]|uniref:uncharacterized protein n=1 Tax=Daldinia decipiens TaxID=326647 RepID=UPI0020C3CBE6|nr:uncharacterized protein F4813DRAFT_356986 [Daldinia decipiens]KAI1658498.1 hypothetical protein F4813DRAFT_356986 [Daldinia decipiens]
MATSRRGRSSSLFSSSSSPHSLSSDWLFVSSPASQSQSQTPPPIRQRTSRKMSPVRSSVANAEQPSPPKRASSLAGFFSKILPSNRPEQGGTRRTDWTGDNDNAVGASRNELTGWNLAKDKFPAHHTSASGPEEPSHRRVWSWSPQKGDSRFVENLPRDRSRGREQVPEVLDREPQPPRKSEALARTEVHELLQSKEETRRNRRSLKESGDWLGVQGADPYSGQFSILTPTDTLSSETTSTSTRTKLAGLARKKKAARLEYEQLRLLEEQEKDKARLDREQAKLNKIERVKEELRRQHQFAKWSQHKRNWSSAAEPNLSPIAQSLDSVALGSSETSSLLFSELHTDSFLSDPEDITSGIPNFSRPNRPPVSKITLPEQAERLSYDSAQPQGRRRLNQSTDTIIHNSPDVNFEPTYLTRPATQPSGIHLDAEQPDIGRTKSERHFLWRRRRGTDPGKLSTAHQGGIVVSMVAQNLTSNSIEHIHKDHFADLTIPDYRLHLLSPEPVDTADSQSTFSEDSPLTTPNPSSLGMNKMGFSSTANLVYSQGNGRSSQSTNTAPAISSSSKLKNIMRRPSIRRKLVPNLLATVHTKDTEKHRMSPPTFDELQDRTVNNLPADASLCQSQPSQPGQQGRTSLEKANRMLHRAENHFKRVRRESVSTPTTTITGCVPAQQSQPDYTQLKRCVEASQVDGTINLINSPTTPASLHQHDPCMTPDLIPEERRTSSLPTTLQNSLLNPERAQEIPGTDISSTRRVTPEKKQPTKVSTPTTPKICRLAQKNGATNQRDISEDRDAVEKTETTKTEKAEHSETKKTIRQERVERVNRESRSRSASITRTPTIISREVHQSLSHEGPKESIVEEAARIAMLRSRAKEIVRSRSGDRKVSRNQSRTPSPVRKQVSNSKTTEPKRSLQKRPRKKRHGEEGAGTGLPSKPEHIEVDNNINKEQNKKGATKGFAGKRDASVTAVQFCKTVYIVVLGLACTWWAIVRPAFNPQSDLWRRRHRKESTWRDMAVFTSAGLFCLAGALCGWYVSRLFRWFLEQ